MKMKNNVLEDVLKKAKERGGVANPIMEKMMKETLQKDEIKEIPLSSLKENPYQPRIEIKPEEIKDLANSIREKGLLQPILVAKADTGYYIVAGHRRVEAHKWLGKDKIKARVIKADEENLASISLIENLQREDLDLIETAMALKKYKEEFDKSYEEIAKEIGKSKSYVVKVISVLNLPKEIINDIKENKSTKDINALNMLNTYVKRISVHMRTDGEKVQEIGENEEFEKGKNEIIELYQGFLKYGRGWLKEEIDKRLKSLTRQKTPGIKMEVGKRKTKIEINIPLTQEAIDKLKALIEEFAEEFKVDNIKIKDSKYLKKQKHIKKEEPAKEEKEDEVKIDYEAADKAFKEIEDVLKKGK
jgi:ParB family chromosome partitioning protein